MITLVADVGTPTGLQFAAFDHVESMPIHAASNATAVTVSVNAWLTLFCGTALSWTVSVNPKDPTAVGVPPITPVSAFTVMPGGSVPSETTHVSDPMQPAAS